MKKIGLLIGAAALCLAGNIEAQVLVGGWDFSTTTNGGSPIPANPSVLKSNFGAGTIYLDGTHGSSDWITPGEASSTGGTPLNALPGWGTSTTTSGLGVNNSAGTKSISFAFSMGGFEDLSVSYAMRRTSPLSFTTHFWEYSSDGVNWSTLQTVTDLTSGSNFQVVTLSTTESLDGATTAYLRLTFSGGGTAASSATRLDNFQLNATAIPEPATPLLLAVGLAGCLARRTRRKKRAA